MEIFGFRLIQGAFGAFISLVGAGVAMIWPNWAVFGCLLILLGIGTLVWSLRDKTNRHIWHEWTTKKRILISLILMVALGFAGYRIVRPTSPEYADICFLDFGSPRWTDPGKDGERPDGSYQLSGMRIAYRFLNRSGKDLYYSNYTRRVIFPGAQNPAIEHPQESYLRKEDRVFYLFSDRVVPPAVRQREPLVGDVNFLFRWGNGPDSLTHELKLIGKIYVYSWANGDLYGIKWKPDVKKSTPDCTDRPGDKRASKLEQQSS